MTALGLLTLALLPTAADSDDPDPEGDEVLPATGAFPDDVAVQVSSKFDGRGTGVINLSDAPNIVTDVTAVGPDEVLPWNTHPGRR